jgi:hypothetical protein
MTKHTNDAVHLRECGVAEKDIGDTIRNWLPLARKMFDDAYIWETLAFIGKRQRVAWNPARFFNLRNEDGRNRFVWHMGNAMKGRGRRRKEPTDLSTIELLDRYAE